MTNTFDLRLNAKVTGNAAGKAIFDTDKILCSANFSPLSSSFFSMNLLSAIHQRRTGGWHSLHELINWM